MKKITLFLLLITFGAGNASANLRIASRTTAAVKDRCVAFKEAAAKFKPHGHLGQSPNVKETIRAFGLPDRIEISHAHPGLIAMIYERKSAWDAFSPDQIPQSVNNGDVCGVIVGQGTVRDVEWK